MSNFVEIVLHNANDFQFSVFVRLKDVSFVEVMKIKPNESYDLTLHLVKDGQVFKINGVAKSEDSKNKILESLGISPAI